MKEPGKLKITVTNILGEEVKTIYDGYANAGRRIFSITELSLTNGVYFLKAEGHLMSDVKRIVCVK